MKKIIITLLFLLSIVSFAHAETSPDVEVKVNGMVCDFCAQGLKKTLGKNEAVKKIDVSLEKGLISIWLKEGKSMNEKEISKAIIDNGISVETVKNRNEKE